MNHKSLFMVSSAYFAYIKSATAFMQLWSLPCQLRCPAGGHVDVYFFGSVRFSSSWECEATFLILDDVLNTNPDWLVVSNIFYFHPYLQKWSNLTNIFQIGWNHQLDDESQAVSAKSILCCLMFFLLPAATWCLLLQKLYSPRRGVCFVWTGSLMVKCSICLPQEFR